MKRLLSVALLAFGVAGGCTGPGRAAGASPSGPAALLSLRDELELTPEQLAKLQIIIDEGREDAMAVLTDEQEGTLNKRPGRMKALMETCHKMMPMMCGMHFLR